MEGGCGVVGWVGGGLSSLFFPFREHPLLFSLLSLCVTAGVGNVKGRTKNPKPTACPVCPPPTNKIIIILNKEETDPLLLTPAVTLSDCFNNGSLIIDLFLNLLPALSPSHNLGTFKFPNFRPQTGRSACCQGSTALAAA